MSLRNKLNFYTVLDRLIPSYILDQDYDKDYSARRNLLQARAVVIVTVSVCVALVLQLLTDLYLILLHGSINESEFPWPITLFGTTLYVAMLYFIPNGKITIVQAAKFGVYFFLLISVYTSCLENGFQTLSHASFFAVPPFGYIFVSKSFGRKTTIVVCLIYVISFFQSIGKKNQLSLSATGWVVCDVYILCFVYFLFVAYEQEFQYNQECMQKSLDEARSAETAKSMFVSNVSHELRTPLHGILATVEILSNSKLNESQRALLNTIESCGTNLISVVNQVLTYAKIEHGKMELEKNAFDIYTVIQEIVDGLAPIPERKRLNFDIYIEMNPMHRFLIGDVGVLRQIILNLLGNAIKFTDNGNVELTTVEITDEVETNQDDKKKISSSSEGRNSESSSVKFRIEVIDTGRGIDPGFMNNMCQPFSQEDSSLRTKFEGTGLGLSIVKGLLDMMHSHLEVKSAVGAGSKFSFVLELPLSQRLESIVPSQFPLDYKYLQLSIEEQNLLISKSQSLSFAILKSENTLFLRQITYYLDQWGFKYRLINKDELKVEFEKEHADIIILNDSVSNLECFLDKLEQFHEAVKVNDENVKNAELEHMNERKQKILFFSTIEDHQNAENALQKHKVQFAVVISKPAGPVKILTAIIKAIESLHSPTAENICVIKEDTTSCNHAQKREICLGNELLLSPSIHGSAADMIEEFSIGVSEKILMSSVYDNTIRTKLAEVELIEERSSTVDGIDEKNMHLITGEEKEIKKKKALKDITFLIVEVALLLQKDSISVIKRQY